jgi:hypothetical protein
MEHDLKICCFQYIKPQDLEVQDDFMSQILEIVKHFRLELGNYC